MHRRLLHLEVGRRGIEHLLAEEFLGNQFLITLEIGLRQSQICFRLLQFSLLHCRIQRHQHGALADNRPILETKCGNSTSGFGAQHHRFIRLQRADGGCLIGKIASRHFGHFDRHREATRWATRLARCASGSGWTSSRRPIRVVGNVTKASQSGNGEGNNNESGRFFHGIDQLTGKFKKSGSLGS